MQRVINKLEDSKALKISTVSVYDKFQEILTRMNPKVIGFNWDEWLKATDMISQQFVKQTVLNNNHLFLKAQELGKKFGQEIVR